jgi:hypothetical protein
VIVLFSDYFVCDIDNFCRFVSLPVGIIVFLFYEKSNVVNKTCQNFLLFPITPHYSQKIARHVLTRLTTITELVLPKVIYSSVHYGFLELFHTVVVSNRLIFICILRSLCFTLVGSRGLPLALSVLGLMSAPGGCMLDVLLCLNVFV